MNNFDEQINNFVSNIKSNIEHYLYAEIQYATHTTTEVYTVLNLFQFKYLIEALIIL